MKERVNVSVRPIKDGVKSLFLDYRIAGKRNRENLKLYLYPERTAADKAKNAETLRIANALRDKREFELEQMEAGVAVKARPTMVSFEEYVKKSLERTLAESTKMNIRVTAKKAAELPKAFVQEMDVAWFQRFVRMLEKDGTAPNTIRLYITIIKQILRMAKDDGLIHSVPNTTDVEPKKERKPRVFLTIEDLKKMIVAECKNSELKRAFLFCCFTGLRFSDVKNLKQKDIVDGSVVLRMKKTREVVRVPLNASATAILADGGLPFRISDNCYMNQILKQWVKASGIQKHVTFHVSRHTFATLALSNGADIYTVSKLLGHTSITTTQIYAKVVDEAKKKAVDAIPTLDL